MRLALAIPLALAVSGCVTDRPSPEPPSAPAADASYRAVGTEPGWSLEIGGGMMRYTGDYGRTRIAVPTPESRPSFNGHRYATRRLTVDITHASCSDGMSDRAYPDTVMVIADGGTEHGCGGPVEKGVGVTLAGTN
ncbi:MAG TPA: META domain-containing protein, partial [Sphingomonas sp.]|nr:META domain-containing protein [Sphingomonas sp.]